jgi:site-specific recombinase XerD
MTAFSQGGTDGSAPGRNAGGKELHGFAPRTQRTYVAWMKRLVSQQRVPADQITEQQVREYLSGLSRRGLSSSTINQAISAVRFFFQEVLHRKWQLEIHYQRAPQRVPVTLRPEEVARLLDAVPNLRDRTAMEIAYASGLRLAEGGGPQLLDQFRGLDLCVCGSTERA